MRVALKVREVPAPDLRNHTVAEATAMLQEEGLVLTVDESGRLDPKIPAGRIAQQEPAPGPSRAVSAAFACGSARARGSPSFPRLPAKPSGPRSCGCSRTDCR